MASLPALVIVNPASRGGTGASHWPRAASALRTHYGPFECRFTRARGDATRIALEESARGRKLLVTFGGDGTISETAHGILQSGKPVELGILPHGTGSDLVRSLPFPSRLESAAAALRRGRTWRLDVGRAVFDDGKERCFLNAASFGLSAEVAFRVNRRGGGSGYLAETFKAASEHSCPWIEVALDSGPFVPLRVTSVSVHNGRYFGGGMRMAPEASLTDGHFDVVVVKKMSIPRLVSRTPLLYVGAHLALPEIEHARGGRLEARLASPSAQVRVEVDGESGYELPARFEIVPRALRIRV